MSDYTLCGKLPSSAQAPASAGLSLALFSLLPQYVAEAPVHVVEAPVYVAEAPRYVAEAPVYIAEAPTDKW